MHFIIGNCVLLGACIWLSHAIEVDIVTDQFQCNNGNLRLRCALGDIVHVLEAHIGVCEDNISQSSDPCCSKQGREWDYPHLKGLVNGRPWRTQYEVFHLIGGPDNFSYNYARLSYKCVSVKTRTAHDICVAGETQLSANSYVLHYSTLTENGMSFCNCSLTAGSKITMSIAYYAFEGSSTLKIQRTSDDGLPGFDKNSKFSKLESFEINKQDKIFLQLQLGEGESSLLLFVSDKATLQCTATPRQSTRNPSKVNTTALATAIPVSLISICALLTVALVLYKRKAGKSTHQQTDQIDNDASPSDSSYWETLPSNADETKYTTISSVAFARAQATTESTNNRVGKKNKALPFIVQGEGELSVDKVPDAEKRATNYLSFYNDAETM